MKVKVRILKATLVALVAAGAILPATAGASTAQVGIASLLYFTAVSETNDLTVGFDGTSYIFTDPGAAITAGTGCTTISVSQVSCLAPTVTAVDIGVGDLNDRVEVQSTLSPLGLVSNPDVIISGGPGDDTLIGGPNVTNAIFGTFTFADGPGIDSLTGGGLDDDLNGGVGEDILEGNEGEDDLRGGDGVDVVNGGGGDDNFDEGVAPNGADQLNGGAGANRISYSGRRGNVTVSLNGSADDGEPLEGDNVTGDYTRIETGSGNDTVAGSDRETDYFTGDGDDSITAGAAIDQVQGGFGNDTLRGGGSSDRIEGNEGNDIVEGGAGDDVIEDGEEPGTRGSDRYGGGPGFDLLLYDADGPLSIDLDGAADDGRPGETDNVGTDVENLVGSRFNDTLIGSSAPNEIDGGAGDDRISGLGGTDALAGGSGDDSLDGGAGTDSLDGAGGSDRLRSRDSSPDEVDCGSSTDTLLADSLDVFTVTCDSSSTGARLVSSNAKLKKGKAKLKVTCPAAEGITCNVSVSAAKGKKVLARGSGKVNSGKASAVTVKLTKAGKKARSNKFALKAKTSFKDASGARVTTTRKLVLSR